MDETRHSPLEGVLPWAFPAEGDNPAVSLSELRFARQIGLRLRPPMPAYIGGVPLPLQPNRVAVMRAVRTLWLGPDEWLITAPRGPGRRSHRSLGEPHRNRDRRERSAVAVREGLRPRPAPARLYRGLLRPDAVCDIAGHHRPDKCRAELSPVCAPLGRALARRLADRRDGRIPLYPSLIRGVARDRRGGA